MDKLKNMGKWKIAVLILALLAVAVGIALFLHYGENIPPETQEYAGMDKSEEILEDEPERTSEEDSPANGLPQEASQEDSEADREENADDTQYPIIIQNDLTQNLDFVFMTEDIYCLDTGDTWIYITQEGEALTPDTYTVAYPFHEGLACACKEGKYGFIDTSGKTVIEFIYDRSQHKLAGQANS